MKAQPSYIRTIKPNQNRSSTEYDSKAILHQIKYLGLQENIRVRRAGFAYRNTFEKMVERFYLLSPATSYAGEYTWQGDPKSGCQQILKDTGIAKDEWQMGVTKAFIKNPETVRCPIPNCVSNSDSALLAFCAGNYARSLLAQHGGSHTTCLPQLPPIQNGVRTPHTAVLEEQQGGNRVCASPRLRTRNPCWTEGTAALQLAQLQAFHGRLLRYQRQERTWGGASNRVWYWM